MCGIVGTFNLDGKAVSRGKLEQMAEAIAHRGPDGEGYYVKGNIGLAHKRLAILDPSERAAQPMTSRNKQWIIVFNGCIYNFKELKQELKTKAKSINTEQNIFFIS